MLLHIAHNAASFFLLPFFHRGCVNLSTQSSKWTTIIKNLQATGFLLLFLPLSLQIKLFAPSGTKFSLLLFRFNIKTNKSKRFLPTIMKCCLLFSQPKPSYRRLRSVHVQQFRSFLLFSSFLHFPTMPQVNMTLHDW